jgi:hypothetical protein
MGISARRPRGELVLSLYGLWQLVCSAELRAYRFLVVTFLALYVFFVATVGRPSYLNGLYGLAAAAGALGLQRRREAGKHRWSWIAWPASALTAAAAVGTLVVSVSMTHSGTAAGTARGVAAAYYALPPGEREHTVIMGQSYILAAWVDLYSSRYAIPRSYSSNRSYGYFTPPQENQDAVLYLGSDPEEVRPHFTTVRKVADDGKDLGIWLCNGKRERWAALWPRLRHLSLSRPSDSDGG